MSEITTNREKFHMTLEFLREENLNPPISVRNAIQDVFDENDKIDNVNFYFKEGKEEFERDLTLENIVNVNLDGITDGQANDIFTYYGETNISLSEFTRLYLGDELIKDDITRVDNSETPTNLLNPDDWVVILHEKTTFNHKNGETGSYEIEDNLLIYCPFHEER